MNVAVQWKITDFTDFTDFTDCTAGDKPGGSLLARGCSAGRAERVAANLLGGARSGLKSAPCAGLRRTASRGHEPQLQVEPLN